MPKTRSSKIARPHIFISHCGSDAWIAQQIANQIEQCGAEPFLDVNDIDHGADFVEELRKSLQRTDELIVLLTPSGLLRPYIWAEVGAAWVRQIPIVVLLNGLGISDVQSDPEVPQIIKDRNMLVLNDVDKYFQQLRAKLRSRTPKRTRGE